ncbi:MAG: hypothetical protein MUP14_07895 [Dehalococcoidia bacterium]|nr:hypothetical protein [Dehalococcoidia bacterium]
MIIPGVDASYDALSPSEARDLKNAGVRVFAQCLWAGSDQPGNRVINLRNAINAGLIPVGYISVTNSHNGVWHVERGRAGVPDDIWGALALVPIDVELDGIPNGIIREAIDETARLGKRPCIYTSYNAWVNKQGNPKTFTDCLLWNALWDENPDIDFPGLPYGGWQPHQVVAEQWAGGDNYVGVFVDRDSFVRELLLPQEDTMSEADKAELYVLRILRAAHKALAENKPQDASNALAHYLGVRPTV